jgi:hypothetical protein
MTTYGITRVRKVLLQRKFQILIQLKYSMVPLNNCSKKTICIQIILCLTIVCFTLSN